MLNVNEILDKIAGILGVKTDSAIAKTLGVSPQAITNARKRGTIPYEKICTFADKSNVSLDDLFFGRTDNKLNTVFLEIIAETLETEQIDMPITFISEPREYVYYSALIYEKVYEKISKLTDIDEQENIISQEVKFLFKIFARDFLKMNPDLNEGSRKAWVPKLEKIAEIKFTPGINKLSKDKPNKHTWGSGSHHDEFINSQDIQQNVEGDSNQVAGRDIVNKKEK